MSNQDTKLLTEAYEKIQEGLWNQAKAKVRGFGAGVASKLAGGSYEQGAQAGRSASIINSYTAEITKLNNKLSKDLATLGLPQNVIQFSVQGLNQGLQQIMQNLQRQVATEEQKLTQSVQQAPVQQAPVQQAPVQQAPVQQAPVQQAPVQQAPVQQAPVQQAPVSRKRGPNGRFVK